MVDQRMTLLVASCDSYSDVWADFFTCKDSNWPDCPYDTVLVTEEKEAVGHVRTFKGGKENNWSTRMRLALESIDTKYICFVMEDFLFADRIQTSEIQELLDLLEKDGIRYCKLCEVGSIKTPFYKEYSYLRIIPENFRYGISLMAAIWDRQFFMEKLGTEDYSPWQFESDRNKEAAVGTDKIVGLYDERNVLHICQLIVQGKIMPDAVKHLRKKNYTVQDKERPRLSFWENSVYTIKVRVAKISKRFPLLKRISKALGYKVKGD